MDLHIETSTPFEMQKDGLHNIFLDNLTLSGKWHGQMRPRFEICAASQTGNTVLAYDGARPVGWALIFEKMPYPTSCIYFYVDKEYRKQGIGTKLMETAKQFCGDNRIEVSIWNPVSQSFFLRFGNTVLNPYVTWTDEDE